MEFSNFLSTRQERCKALVEQLSAHFEYVSILGADIKTQRTAANKFTTSIGEGRGTDCGFVVKLCNGGAFKEYSLDDIDEDIATLADKIVASLHISPLLKAEQISVADMAQQSLQKEFERESDLHKFSAAQMLDFCKDMKDELLSKDDNILNATAMLSTMDVSKMFVSTQKLLKQHYCWVDGAILVVYREGDKMVYARESGGSHLLQDVIDKLHTKTDAVVSKAKRLVQARPITPGVYDVITDPSITGLIAHEAFGHGVEMDQFVKDRALAKQFVGKPVASPIVNMRDGAASALSVASYFFDDDGELAQDTQIIKDGILVSGICDMVSAKQLGCAPTGNGRRESHKRKAYTRMTNTFFEAGDSTLDEMIKSIKHGYMLFETNNGMEDPKNWAIQCVAEYGIEIVDGKLTDNYVSPVVMSGYVPDLLKSITMVSNDFVVDGAGSCGKGYKEWVRVSDGGPALKARVKLG